MAERFPRSRFVGHDLRGTAIASAARSTAERRLGNVRFAVRDVAGFDEASRYDIVCVFDTVHDQRDPAGLLRAAARALKPGGRYRHSLPHDKVDVDFVATAA